MNGGAQLALPPFTRWVKRLIIIHAVGYIAWLIVGRWGGQAEIAREMVLTPADVHAGKAWQLVTYLIPFANPFYFLLEMLMLWMFGGQLEVRWGARRFVGTYLIIGIGSAGLVTLLALGIDQLAILPILGPGAITLGLTVAWGMIYAEQRVYFFGIFPIKGKHMILIALGIIALYAIASNPMGFVIHAFGAVLAALLVVGWWRPRRLLGSLRAAWLRRRARRTRKHLRSVGEDDDDRRYLH